MPDEVPTRQEDNCVGAFVVCRIDSVRSSADLVNTDWICPHHVYLKSRRDENSIDVLTRTWRVLNETIFPLRLGARAECSWGLMIVIIKYGLSMQLPANYVYFEPFL